MRTVACARKCVGATVSIDPPENTMRPDLESDHPKRVNVRCFRWPRAMFEQFWRYLMQIASADRCGDGRAQ